MRNQRKGCGCDICLVLARRFWIWYCVALAIFVSACVCNIVWFEVEPHDEFCAPAMSVSYLQHAASSRAPGRICDFDLVPGLKNSLGDIKAIFQMHYLPLIQPCVTLDSPSHLRLRVTLVLVKNLAFNTRERSCAFYLPPENTLTLAVSSCQPLRRIRAY